MADESFILLDVNDSESKKMAQVISNETSRKILDYLADKKDATETQIAKDLKVPLSTVHYNLKLLVKVKLVLNDEYHYSQKGKTIDHYKLANKFVIIAPKATKKEGLGEVLKRFIPVTLIAFTSAVVLFVNKLFSSTNSISSMSAVPRMVAESTPLITKSVPQAVAFATDSASGVAANSAQYISPAIKASRYLPENIALWFFIGAISAIILQLIVEVIRNKVKKDKKEKKKEKKKNRKRDNN